MKELQKIACWNKLTDTEKSDLQFFFQAYTTSLLELIEKEKSEDDNEKQQWILLKRYWWDAGLSKAQQIISNNE